MKLKLFLVKTGTHTDENGVHYTKGMTVKSARDLIKAFGDGKFQAVGEEDAPTVPCAIAPAPKTPRKTPAVPVIDLDAPKPAPVEEVVVFDDGETPVATAEDAEPEGPLFVVEAAKAGWFNVVNTATKTVMNAKALRKVPAQKLCNQLNG